MSPARAEAAARADELAPARRPSAPARLRPAAAPPDRLARVGAVLRSGNLIGRVGTLTAIALFVAVFGVVVFQALLVQGQARLDHLNAQITNEQQTSKQLELRLAQLDSPSRIVTSARALGMIDAGDVVYLQPAATDDARASWTTSATTTTVPVTTTTIPSTTTTAPPTSTTAATATTTPSGKAHRP
jgi:hypothetical protein